MNKNEYDFLKEYEKVCQKYKIFIGSCGCCSSPYLDGKNCDNGIDDIHFDSDKDCITIGCMHKYTIDEYYREFGK